ncbi:MAG: ATP-dependent helicase HrpB [Candidatus Melainabacteria bacterium]|nr:ATP-dependent helicase HrpB [Candidatus Melainabacteria bacterium]
MDSLPINDVIPDIVSHLSQSGAVIVVAEPGAGKTTCVPPALLKLASDVSPKGQQIILLQPRRIAARAAAFRISDEMKTRLGEEVGFQVRHESRCSNNTKILVCTEGIFLRKLQEDPTLGQVSIVIFDEFHERNLDSDLCLALVRQVQSEIRPELKIVVMSATLEALSVSQFLNNCPVVKSAGRNFPVDIEYLSAQEDSFIENKVVDAVKSCIKSSQGHVLAFLPGVREIKRSEELLESFAKDNDLLLMPLYGEMSLEEQSRVLQESQKRKIVLATNVAETSITINGISAVVDSGLARVNRLDPRLGLNSLQLERISKASAEQRAGRAGRTQSGQCLRLWTKREDNNMAQFNDPEINRVELSSCILQLLNWGETNLENFHWFQKPPQKNLKQAIELLEQIDATTNGALTDDGRLMATLPVQPRLARLLIEGAKFGHAKAAALCAALLSNKDPVKRGDEILPGGSIRQKSKSDVLDRVFMLEQYQKTGLKDSYLGELSVGPTKQILFDADQLYRLVKPLEKEFTSVKKNDEDEALMRAILVAYADRICRRRESGKNTALMLGGRGVRLSDESGVTDAEFFVAVELIETGKSDALVRQASAIELSWLPQSHISSTIVTHFDADRMKVVASKRKKFFDFILDENIVALPTDIDTGVVLARGLCEHKIDIGALVDDDSKQLIARIDCLNNAMPDLGLPLLSDAPWMDFLIDWCSGLSSLEELKTKPLSSIILAGLTYEQKNILDQEAPEKFLVPSGSHIKLVYESGKPPVLAARIQELFGMKETPKIAQGRISLLIHLLAPNFRVQQITPDLAGFWKNTYVQVRKDLKARYPKHSWPDDPLTAHALRGAKRKD